MFSTPFNERHFYFERLLSKKMTIILAILKEKTFYESLEPFFDIKLDSIWDRGIDQLIYSRVFLAGEVGRYSAPQIRSQTDALRVELFSPDGRGSETTRVGRERVYRWGGRVASLSGLFEW